VRLGLTLLLLVALLSLSFSYSFFGLEARTFPPPPPPPSGESAPPPEEAKGGGMEVEIFARFDYWIFYFMLPFAHYNGGFQIVPLDMEMFKRLLGVGIALRAPIFEGAYLRVSADMPIMEWVETLEGSRGFKTNFGLQYKLGMLMLEAGANVSSFFDVESRLLGFDFSRFDYYLAAGMTF